MTYRCTIRFDQDPYAHVRVDDNGLHYGFTNEGQLFKFKRMFDIKFIPNETLSAMNSSSLVV